MNVVPFAQHSQASTLPKDILDLGDAALATADPDDLAFTVEAVLREQASTIPLSVEIDGANSSAIVWVEGARRLTVDGDDFWFLSSRLTDLVSRNQWASGLNANCVLIVPIDAETDKLGSACYLTPRVGDQA